MPLLAGREIKRFIKYRQYIRRFLKELRKASHYINEDEHNRRFLMASGIKFQLPHEYEEQCNQIADADIALIVFGQNNYAKAAVVNNLFRRNLLPTTDKETNGHWHLVNIHYSHASTPAIPLSDLKIAQGTNRCKHIDVPMSNELLLVEGLRIIVTPSCECNTVEEIFRVFHVSCSKVLPILIYAFENKLLIPQDLVELTELRRLAGNQPILFIVAPTRDKYHLTPHSLLWYQRAHQRKHHRTISACLSENKTNKSENAGVLESVIANDEAMTGNSSKNNKIIQATSLGDVQNGSQQQKFPSQDKIRGKADADQLVFTGDHMAVLKHLGFLCSTSTEGYQVDSGTCLPAGGHFSTLHSTEPITTAILEEQGNTDLLQNEKNVPVLIANRKCPNRTLDTTSIIVTDFDDQFIKQLQVFIRRCLQNYLLWALDVIDNLTVRCLHGLVLQAFELSHSLFVTPKRIEYAKTQEAKLYENLLKNARQRHPETYTIISQTIKEMRRVLPDLAARQLNFTEAFSTTPIRNSLMCDQTFPALAEGPLSVQSVLVPPASSSQSASPSQSVVSLPDLPPQRTPGYRPKVAAQREGQNDREGTVSMSEKLSPRQYNMAIQVVHDYVLCKLTHAIASRVLAAMQVTQQSYIGTLERTIANLEHQDSNDLGLIDRVFSCPYTDCCAAGEEVDVDTQVSTSEQVSSRMDLTGGVGSLMSSVTAGCQVLAADRVNHYECIFHSGQWSIDLRPLSSENSQSERRNAAGKKTQQPTSVRDALKALLRFTYDIHVPAKFTPSAQLTRLFRKVKEVFSYQTSWTPDTHLDAAWTSKTAQAFLNSLSESAIAKELHCQVTDKLYKSHNHFLSTLEHLEIRTGIRNCQFEESQESILKQHAPRLARIALESSSLGEYLLHGLPTLGREIGRGQYGVVYKCLNWAAYSHLAVKSIVPSDERHWKDLALEIYFSKQIPRHERIVTLYASIIDYGYKQTPAALLVMERLVRDLHLAIRQGLAWLTRITVAQDAIEGLRFLHNQGLVHRDVKPRNVLLDKYDRAKLTDMGFCKPKAMISGSVLGTPTHMAPEIFEHYYDSSVDVYAFAILFWYLCAGDVRIPGNFQKCGNRGILWHAVRKGLRPERLQLFTDECWTLMQTCWDGVPLKRPHTGQIAEVLQEIREHEMEKVLSKEPTENGASLCQSIATQSNSS